MAPASTESFWQRHEAHNCDEGRAVGASTACAQQPAGFHPQGGLLGGGKPPCPPVPAESTKPAGPGAGAFRSRTPCMDPAQVSSTSTTLRRMIKRDAALTPHAPTHKFWSILGKMDDEIAKASRQSLLSSPSWAPKLPGKSAQALTSERGKQPISQCPWLPAEKLRTSSPSRQGLSSLAS